jgi:hypothetical protein
MATRHRRADILVRDAQGQPMAIVEIRNRQNLSRDIATELRRNLAAYGVPVKVPYFLLLSQDVGFLWKEPNSENLDASPNYEFPMDKVVARYLKENSDQRLYGSILEVLVYHWLNDLATRPQNENEEPEKTLAEAGFNESIKGATVVAEDEL